jgi:hypothetical protein
MSEQQKAVSPYPEFVQPKKPPGRVAEVRIGLDSAWFVSDAAKAECLALMQKMVAEVSAGQQQLDSEYLDRFASAVTDHLQTCLRIAYRSGWKAGADAAAKAPKTIEMFDANGQLLRTAVETTDPPTPPRI